ncbi:MAG: hypothetical protein ACOC35_15140 [Promethearchaeia archaeon]
MERYTRLFKYLLSGIPELNGLDFTTKYYKSKKNLVYELTFEKYPEKYPNSIVIKKFPLNSEKMEKEIEILSKLNKQQLNVPKLLFYDKDEFFLILEKIEGQNVCDYINDTLSKHTDIADLSPSKRENIITAVEQLAKWAANLHKKNIINDQKHTTTVLNKGDTRLRDFIVNFKANKLYGVDFEESYVGNHIDDLAWICCSLLDTNPGIFEMDIPTHKISLVNQFLIKYYKVNHNFTFSFEYFADSLIENLNNVMERRHLDIGYFDKKTILKRISDNL